MRSSDYDRFPFNTKSVPTIRGLIDDLIVEYGEEFHIYFDDVNGKVLRNDVVVIVNGRVALMVWKLDMGYEPESVLDTELHDGDTVVFMIAVAGG